MYSGHFSEDKRPPVGRKEVDEKVVESNLKKDYVEGKLEEHDSMESLLEVAAIFNESTLISAGFFLIRFGIPPSGIVIPVMYRLPPFPFFCPELVVLPLICTGISLKAFLLLILTNLGRKYTKMAAMVSRATTMPIILVDIEAIIVSVATKTLIVIRTNKNIV
jgi:hypothetical protein